MKALTQIIRLLCMTPIIPGFILSPATTTRRATAFSLNNNNNNPWQDFDYNQKWYPVVWQEDVRVNQPTKVSLFDVDYVVAITKDKEITALVDQCPHKKAALSEGRMTHSGLLQCAYHGWKFDRDGTCQQIPQSPDLNSYPKRTCATAVAAKLHQGMIWLWPGPAPQGNNNSTAYPDPPSIPEMDDPSFVVTRVIRDFPNVDWTLLVSNILDPDHGLFAHQAKPFDWYSASPEYPLRIEQNYDNQGWYLKTSVPAVDKLLEYDGEKRGKKKKKKKKASNKPPPLATSVFQAPTTVSLSRRSPDDDTTVFVSGFWVCPTGTGRSRFMAASIAKAPKWVKIPRWVYHYGLNNFLDQDTVLVASQQPPVLSAEYHNQGRSKLFSYSSPTDKAVSLIDKFWDATVSKVPNRAGVLKTLYETGQLRHTPPRRVVLDRHVQHLNICPDSQDSVRNCQRIRNTGVTVVLGYIAACLFQRTILSLKGGRWAVAVAAVAAFVAEKVRQSYYFMYPEDKRNRDLRNIPTKTWSDV